MQTLRPHTHVVFLQHPREARMPFTTCRLAHLSLDGSELHVGMRAEGNPRLEALAQAPGTHVLFPGPGAVDVRDLEAPPSTLLVVDGTWINARKLIQRSPLLAALPRVAFTPDRPSAYRIRREPTPTCVSTIEAVAHILDVLEGTPGRYAPILGAFDRMVERQLDFIAARSPLTCRKGGPRTPTALDKLRVILPRAVLVYVEADPWARAGARPVLHRWSAERWTDGARFDATVGPTAPLPAPTAIEALPAAAARWQAWLPPDDVLLTWGEFPPRLLASVGLAPARYVDLKRVATNRLHRRLGGVERFAEDMGGPLPGVPGTVDRRLAALRQAAVGLLRVAHGPTPATPGPVAPGADPASTERG